MDFTYSNIMKNAQFSVGYKEYLLTMHSQKLWE